MLYMIGNAHIDAVWLWQWQEGFAEVLATFRSALDRIAEYPQFTFTCSSAAYHEWVEGNDPEMFAEISRRVTEGRWKIVGGWWVEPDCNLPCGESFVRQGLIGQRAFQRMFGRRATVGYNVDSFGHSAMLPQILTKMGLTRYVFMRPDAGEKRLPASSFWWQSPDGSRVLAYRIPFAYTTDGRELADHVHRCAGLLSEEEPELMCFYGVGNHGGGPTRRNIESIARLQAAGGEAELRMSSPEEFFESLEMRASGLPVVAEELQHHSRGCYSVRSEVKRLNRLAETRLLNAESFSLIASLLTTRPFDRDITRAWKGVLFNQFHDILAGTSIESAYGDARDQLGEALAIASRSTNSALRSIARSIEIPRDDPPGRPLVVFNPNCFEAREPVEIELFHDGQVGESGLRPDDELVDEEGVAVPFQLVQSEASLAGRSRLLFQAGVGALSYRCYRVRRREGEPPAPEGSSRLHAGENWAENGELRIEVDPGSGSLRRLVDMSAGRELLGPTGAVVLRDRSDTWSHGVARYDERIGEFAATQVRLVEDGPVRAMIRSTAALRDSRLTQDFLIYRASRFVEVRVRLDWRERQCALKLRFPAAIDEARATYEVPFGAIARETNGEEEPGQSWIDLSGVARGTRDACGISLANNAKYAYSVEDSTLCLTVVRSPISAHHDPMIPDPQADYRCTDQGEQCFTYRLVPHVGDWREGETVRLAASLNNPFVALSATYHGGGLPPAMRFLRIDSANIFVTALKRAEDGDDVILRCCELHGRRTAARIGIERFGLEIACEFGPYEIKTFRIPRAAPQRYREVNLLEEPFGEAPASAIDADPGV